MIATIWSLAKRIAAEKSERNLRIESKKREIRDLLEKFDGDDARLAQIDSSIAALGELFAPRPGGPETVTERARRPRDRGRAGPL